MEKKVEIGSKQTFERHQFRQEMFSDQIKSLSNQLSSNDNDRKTQVSASLIELAMSANSEDELENSQFDKITSALSAGMKTGFGDNQMAKVFDSALKRTALNDEKRVKRIQQLQVAVMGDSDAQNEMETALQNLRVTVDRALLDGYIDIDKENLVRATGGAINPGQAAAVLEAVARSKTSGDTKQVVIDKVMKSKAVEGMNPRELDATFRVLKAGMRQDPNQAGQGLVDTVDPRNQTDNKNQFAAQTRVADVLRASVDVQGTTAGGMAPDLPANIPNAFRVFGERFADDLKQASRSPIGVGDTSAIDRSVSSPTPIPDATVQEQREYLEAFTRLLASVNATYQENQADAGTLKQKVSENTRQIEVLKKDSLNNMTEIVRLNQENVKLNDELSSLKTQLDSLNKLSGVFEKGKTVLETALVGKDLDVDAYGEDNVKQAMVDILDSFDDPRLAAQTLESLKDDPASDFSYALRWSDSSVQQAYILDKAKTNPAQFATEFKGVLEANPEFAGPFREAIRGAIRSSEENGDLQQKVLKSVSELDSKLTTEYFRRCSSFIRMEPKYSSSLEYVDQSSRYRIDDPELLTYSSAAMLALVDAYNASNDQDSFLSALRPDKVSDPIYENILQPARLNDTQKDAFLSHLKAMYLNDELRPGSDEFVKNVFQKMGVLSDLAALFPLAQGTPDGYKADKATVDALFGAHVMGDTGSNYNGFVAGVPAGKGIAYAKYLETMFLTGELTKYATDGDVNNIKDEVQNAMLALINKEHENLNMKYLTEADLALPDFDADSNLEKAYLEGGTVASVPTVVSASDVRIFEAQVLAGTIDNLASPNSLVLTPQEFLDKAKPKVSPDLTGFNYEFATSDIEFFKSFDTISRSIEDSNDAANNQLFQIRSELKWELDRRGLLSGSALGGQSSFDKFPLSHDLSPLENQTQLRRAINHYRQWHPAVTNRDYSDSFRAQNTIDSLNKAELKLGLVNVDSVAMGIATNLNMLLQKQGAPKIDMMDITDARSPGAKKEGWSTEAEEYRNLGQVLSNYRSDHSKDINANPVLEDILQSAEDVLKDNVAEFVQPKMDSLVTLNRDYNECIGKLNELGDYVDPTRSGPLKESSTIKKAREKHLKNITKLLDDIKPFAQDILAMESIGLFYSDVINEHLDTFILQDFTDADLTPPLNSEVKERLKLRDAAIAYANDDKRPDDLFPNKLSYNAIAVCMMSQLTKGERVVEVNSQALAEHLRLGVPGERGVEKIKSTYELNEGIQLDSDLSEVIKGLANPTPGEVRHILTLETKPDISVIEWALETQPDVVSEQIVKEMENSQDSDLLKKLENDVVDFQDSLRFRPDVVASILEQAEANPTDYNTTNALNIMLKGLYKHPDDLAKVWFLLKEKKETLDTAADLGELMLPQESPQLGELALTPGGPPATDGPVSKVPKQSLSSILNPMVQVQPIDNLKTLAIVMGMDVFDKAGHSLQSRYDLYRSMNAQILSASPEKRAEYLKVLDSNLDAFKPPLIKDEDRLNVKAEVFDKLKGMKVMLELTTLPDPAIAGPTVSKPSPLANMSVAKLFSFVGSFDLGAAPNTEKQLGALKTLNDQCDDCIRDLRRQWASVESDDIGYRFHKGKLLAFQRLKEKVAVKALEIGMRCRDNETSQTLARAGAELLEPSSIDTSSIDINTLTPFLETLKFPSFQSYDELKNHLVDFAKSKSPKLKRSDSSVRDRADHLFLSRSKTELYNALDRRNRNLTIVIDRSIQQLGFSIGSDKEVKARFEKAVVDHQNVVQLAADAYRSFGKSGGETILSKFKDQMPKILEMAQDKDSKRDLLVNIQSVLESVSGNTHLESLESFEGCVDQLSTFVISNGLTQDPAFLTSPFRKVREKVIIAGRSVEGARAYMAQQRHKELSKELFGLTQEGSDMHHDTAAAFIRHTDRLEYQFESALKETYESVAGKTELVENLTQDIEQFTKQLLKDKESDNWRLSYFETNGILRRLSVLQTFYKEVDGRMFLMIKRLKIY